MPGSRACICLPAIEPVAAEADVRPFLTLALAGAACCLAAGAQAASLLTNGGFEDGPALNFGTYYRGPLAPTGWSVLAGYTAPDILSSAYVQSGGGFAQLLSAHGGNRYLDTNSASPTGGLYQDISGLAPGSLLTLSFWSGQWAQNSSGTLVASLMDGATVLGGTTVVLPYSPGATSASWTEYVVTAIAPTSGTVRVQFIGASGSTARGAPALDDVSLTVAGAAVPEPGAWALMILGFGLAGGALRGRWAATAIS